MTNTMMEPVHDEPGTTLEDRVAAKPYPKVEKEVIDAKIRSVDYLYPDDTTLTFCMITMDNGFVVTGQSACVDSRNFDPAIGAEYAYKDAYSKIWQLEGYALASLLRRDYLGIHNEDRQFQINALHFLECAIGADGQLAKPELVKALVWGAHYVVQAMLQGTRAENFNYVLQEARTAAEAAQS